MVSEDQLHEFEITFNTFKALMGDRFAAFCTDAVREDNLTIMAEWGASNLAGGVAGAKNIGWFELAFVNCATKLKRDPSWKSWATRRAELKREDDSMPAAEFKQRYATDPEFKRYIDEEKK
jgi:hypothetical protein